MRKTWMMIFVGLFSAGLVCADGSKETLAVATVDATPALTKDMKNRGMEAPFSRVLEALDQHLVTSLAQTQKFSLLARNKQLDHVIKERDLLRPAPGNGGAAPDIGQLKGAKYTLTTTMDSFLENSEFATFAEGKKMKRRFQLSAQVVIVDNATGEIFDTANVQLEKIDIVDVPANEGSTAEMGARTDEIMPVLARELAEKVAASTVQSVFPIKVIDIEDEKVLTLNRGASFFAEGDVVEVFGASRTISDPDTGATIKRKGKSVGKARITSVEPTYSLAQVLENNGVKVGCQANKLAMPRD